MAGALFRGRWIKAQGTAVQLYIGVLSRMYYSGVHGVRDAMMGNSVEYSGHAPSFM
jgi:hypothetical protein